MSGSLASTIGEANPFRYRGYYYDTETGLFYVGSRYYDPEIGRFINADSVVAGIGGDIRGYNMFAYCMNNPVNMDDPTGQWPRWITAVVAVAAVVVAVAVPVLAPIATKVAIAATATLVVQTLHYDVREAANKSAYKSSPTPKSLDDIGWKNSKPKTSDNPNGGGPKDSFHQFSAKNKDTPNVKYVSPDGHQELIFNGDSIVLDPRDIGTYNVVPSGGFWGTAGHILFDVAPWFVFGNSDDDWGPLINIFTD